MNKNFSDFKNINWDEEPKWIPPKVKNYADYLRDAGIKKSDVGIPRMMDAVGRANKIRYYDRTKRQAYNERKKKLEESPKKYCKTCGTIVDSSSQFCHHCGKRLAI